MKALATFLIISLLLTGNYLQAGSLLPAEIKAVVASSPRTQLQEETLQLLLIGWQKIFGLTLSVQDFSATPEGYLEGYLFLGETALKAGLIQPAELKKVWPGGHVMETVTKSVAFCDNTNRDTNYAEVFLYAGFGPARYGENCPPKTAVAIYVEGNCRHLSSHMEAEFTLEEVPANGSSLLEVEGQDCDHDVSAACIRILVNNQTIFEGPVSLVKKNWSRQSFPIPPGVLKKGTNTISFVNTGAPDSINNWFERWFMLSEAVIRFSQMPD